MKETMYTGVGTSGADVIFCVRGDKVVHAPYKGPSDPWHTPQGFIGFTYWPNVPYTADDYSNVQMVWERDV